MPIRALKSDLLLLLTATIWGFAFVAQRVGMDYVGPFTYNGIRFALGALSLLPFVLISKRGANRLTAPSLKVVLLGGGLAGLFVFIAGSLQQTGLLYTTAGKAGFITGLYVVLVPIVGLFARQRTAVNTWLGAICAAVGLYFLSVTASFTMERGDLLELIGALFWAGHIQVVGYFSRRMNPVKLACLQFSVCSFLSLFSAAIFETIAWQGIQSAAIPILYGGLLSVGVAYTLQVVAQKDAHPAHAAVLMSLESVFAVIGGWFVLHETLSMRGFIGCALMFAGMLLSQFKIDRFNLKR